MQKTAIEMKQGRGGSKGKKFRTEVELILLRANRSMYESMDGRPFSIFKSIRL